MLIEPDITTDGTHEAVHRKDQNFVEITSMDRKDLKTHFL